MSRKETVGETVTFCINNSHNFAFHDLFLSPPELNESQIITDSRSLVFGVVSSKHKPHKYKEKQYYSFQ